MSSGSTPTLTDAPAPDAGPADGPQPAQSARLADLAGRFAMVAVLILLVIAAEIAYHQFLTSGNIENLLQQNAPVGLVAIGMTFVLIAGGFDLSVGGIFALGGVLYATLANDMPVGLAFALMIPIAGLIGIANGLIITRLRVNAFVATLGSASIFSGIAYLVNTSGAVTVTKTSFAYLGTTKWLGLPAMVWILAAAFVAAGVLLSRTVYGRSVYIVGGNSEAARLSGMRVSTIQASTYVLTALAATVAGMLLSSQTGVGQADVGSDVTLNAIAIVIIGGTSLRGGQGSIQRTLVGLLIVSTIDNVFNSLAVNTAIQSVATGAIVILAVALDAWTRRAR
jgi:ribose transport system permease protein